MNELYWAAGFYDGEGHFQLRTQKRRYHYPAIVIGQKDREVLDRFQAAIGVGKVYGPYNGSNRFMYQSTGKAAVDGMRKIENLIGRIKQEQFYAVLDKLADKN